MKATTIAGITAGFFVLGYWGKKKVDDYSEFVTQMGLDFSNIHDLRTKNGKFYFNCDITFINNTKIAFSPITAGMIVVKRVSIKSNGQIIGNAFSNTSQFDLPANGTQKIKEVVIELVSLNLIAQLTNGTFSTDPANYTVEVEITALGKTYIIEQ